MVICSNLLSKPIFMFKQQPVLGNTVKFLGLGSLLSFSLLFVGCDSAKTPAEINDEKSAPTKPTTSSDRSKTRIQQQADRIDEKFPNKLHQADPRIFVEEIPEGIFNTIEDQVTGPLENTFQQKNNKQKMNTDCAAGWTWNGIACTKN